MHHKRGTHCVPWQHGVPADPPAAQCHLHPTGNHCDPRPYLRVALADRGSPNGENSFCAASLYLFLADFPAKPPSSASWTGAERATDPRLDISSAGAVHYCSHTVGSGSTRGADKTQISANQYQIAGSKHGVSTELTLWTSGYISCQAMPPRTELSICSATASRYVLEITYAVRSISDHSPGITTLEVRPILSMTKTPWKLNAFWLNLF